MAEVTSSALGGFTGIGGVPSEWYNPVTMRYERPSTYAGGETYAGLAGTIVPSLPARTQYELAAGALSPGYVDRPWQRDYMESLYQPLYGRYLAQYPGFAALDEAGEPITPGRSFAQYVRGVPSSQALQAMGVDSLSDWADQADRTYAPPVGLGSAQYPLTQNAAPQNWSDIINVARGATGFTADPDRDSRLPAPAYDRYIDMLTDQETAKALTSMATFDPMAGSIYGGLRQRGLARARDAFMRANPQSIGSERDWLGYITRKPGYTSAAYRVA